MSASQEEIFNQTIQQYQQWRNKQIAKDEDNIQVKSSQRQPRSPTSQNLKRINSPQGLQGQKRATFQYKRNPRIPSLKIGKEAEPENTAPCELNQSLIGITFDEFMAQLPPTPKDFFRSVTPGRGNQNEIKLKSYTSRQEQKERKEENWNRYKQLAKEREQKRLFRVKSAIKIQSLVRGWIVRIKFKRQIKKLKLDRIKNRLKILFAGDKICALLKKFVQIKRQKQLAIWAMFEEHCAICIQAVWKGHAIRRYYQPIIRKQRVVRKKIYALVQGWKVRKIMQTKAILNVKQQITDIHQLKLDLISNPDEQLEKQIKIQLPKLVLQLINNINRMMNAGNWLSYLQILSKANSPQVVQSWMDEGQQAYSSIYNEQYEETNWVDERPIKPLQNTSYYQDTDYYSKQYEESTQVDERPIKPLQNTNYYQDTDYYNEPEEYFDDKPVNYPIDELDERPIKPMQQPLEQLIEDYEVKKPINTKPRKFLKRNTQKYDPLQQVKKAKVQKKSPIKKSPLKKVSIKRSYTTITEEPSFYEEESTIFEIPSQQSDTDSTPRPFLRRKSQKMAPTKVNWAQKSRIDCWMPKNQPTKKRKQKVVKQKKRSPTTQTVSLDNSFESKTPVSSTPIPQDYQARVLKYNQDMQSQYQSLKDLHQHSSPGNKRLGAYQLQRTIAQLNREHLNVLTYFSKRYVPDTIIPVMQQESIMIQRINEDETEELLAALEEEYELLRNF